MIQQQYSWAFTPEKWTYVNIKASMELFIAVLFVAAQNLWGENQISYKG